MAVLKLVPLKNKGFYPAVAQYSNGKKHIIIKSGSYMIVREGIPSSLITEKDMEILKKLPNSPEEAIKMGMFISEK